jgi:V8-like Glu-specific endopeptidase
MKLISLIFLAASVVAGQTARSRKDIPAIAKAANGAIVSIILSDKDGHAIAQGTGFLISKDGRIVTNYHVIESGSSAVVKLPDGAFFVVDGVVAFDKARDVAVIKAHGDNFRTLTLGNSDRVQVGEEVAAIGNPLSLESTVSNGIVSGIRTTEELGGKFLQITTPISHGSSGGPLFNMAGEVVGITTLYLKGGENLNFAIPINDVKRLLPTQFSKTQPLPDEPESDKTHTLDGDAQSRNQLIAGLYQSEPSGRYWQYLRIYSDGTVIEATSSGTPDDLANWFGRPYSDTGRYQVQGSTIVFSIASPYGTVDYRGQIQGTVLSMDSFSHINGHREHCIYHLVRSEGGDAPPSASGAALTSEYATDLETTVQFMGRMVDPEHRRVLQGQLKGAEPRSPSGASITIVSNQPMFEVFTTGETHEHGYPEFTYSVLSDSNGDKNFPRYISFSLRAIDPSSIKSEAGGYDADALAKFWDKRPKCEADPQCTHEYLSFLHSAPRTTSVNFHTTDLEPLIERGGFESQTCSENEKRDGRCGLKPALTDTTEKVTILFNDTDRAERFVTALRYAVKSEGGKPDSFPPTH